MNNIDELIQFLTKFPGVGRRQARRFAYHLLGMSNSQIDGFIKLLKKNIDSIHQCDHCYALFSEDSGGHNLCSICRNNLTNKRKMMIVEKDIDCENIRRSGVYDGRYFILGGLMPLSTKKERAKIRIKELFNETKRAIKDDGLDQIILGLSINSEGEHTAMYIRSKLESLAGVGRVTISTLGRGLSTGAELEYMDRETLESAMNTRTSTK